MWGALPFWKYFFCLSYDFRKQDNGCYLSASNANSAGVTHLGMSTDGSDHYPRASWKNDCVPWSGKAEDLGTAIRIRNSDNEYLSNNIMGAPTFTNNGLEGEKNLYQVIDTRVSTEYYFDIGLASPIAGNYPNAALGILASEEVFGDTPPPHGTVHTQFQNNTTLDTNNAWFGFEKLNSYTTDPGEFIMLEAEDVNVCSPNSGGVVDCSENSSLREDTALIVESCDRNFH